MKKSMFYNNGFAVSLTAAVIVLSFLLGGARGLNSVRGKAVKEFESERGVSYYVENIADASLGTVAVIAGKYASGDGDARALSAAANGIRSAKRIEDYYKNYSDLTKALNSLYKKLDANKMNEIDRGNWYGAEAEIEVSRNIISSKNDEYNKMAAEFNNAAGAFPANVIKTARLIRPLPIFSEVK